MKPRGWKPFVSDDNKMLWIGMLTRDTGIPASRRLQIRDEVVALDFDLAVSLRLFRFDNEKSVNDAKRIAYEVSKMFSEGGGDDDSILNSNEIGEMIRNDPYADENTRIS